MVPADERCVCPGCGAVCRGRFQGCSEVWSRGPQAVSLISKAAAQRPDLRDRPKSGHIDAGPAASNGRPDEGPVPSSEENASASEPITTIGLGQVIENKLASVSRHLQETQELQIRSRFERIESRLDQLIAMHEDKGLRDKAPATDGTPKRRTPKIPP